MASIIFLALALVLGKSNCKRLPTSKPSSIKEKLKRKFGVKPPRQESNEDSTNDKLMGNEEDIEDQYDRNGNYYKCRECSKYTLHVNNDKFCENDHCPSNNEEEAETSSSLRKMWPSIYSNAPKPL